MTDAGTTTAGPRRRTPRWVLAALLLSLALNLLIIGAVTAAVWRFKSHAVLGRPVPNLLGYASTLPAERWRDLRARTVAERQQIKPFRREVRLAREELLRAFEAEPFDKQRFDTAQHRLLEAENRAKPAVHELYARLAESMTAEERRGFQRWRERVRPPASNLLDEPDRPALAKDGQEKH